MQKSCLWLSRSWEQRVSIRGVPHCAEMASPEYHGLAQPLVGDHPERNGISARKPSPIPLKLAAAGCRQSHSELLEPECFPEGARTDASPNLSQEPKGAPGTPCIIMAQCLHLQGSPCLATCKCSQSSWKGNPGEKTPDPSFYEAELLCRRLFNVPGTLGISPKQTNESDPSPATKETFSVFLFPNLAEKMQMDTDPIKMLSPMIDSPDFVSLPFGLLAWQQLNLTK